MSSRFAPATTSSDAVVKDFGVTVGVWKLLVLAIIPVSKAGGNVVAHHLRVYDAQQISDNLRNRRGHQVHDVNLAEVLVSGAGQC